MKTDIINDIIEVEGDYSNNPNDLGGATRWGITEEVARTNGYTGSMQELPKAFAFDIYADLYWNSVHADDMPIELAAEVVDTGINMGVGTASKFLQTSLNVLNRGGKLYSDLKVDGHIGNRTIQALSAYLNVRDLDVLLTALNCLQGARYIELCLKREKNETFVYGWLKNRIIL